VSSRSDLRASSFPKTSTFNARPLCMLLTSDFTEECSATLDDPVCPKRNGACPYERRKSTAPRSAPRDLSPIPRPRKTMPRSQGCSMCRRRQCRAWRGWRPVNRVCEAGPMRRTGRRTWSRGGIRRVSWVSRTMLGLLLPCPQCRVYLLNFNLKAQRHRRGMAGRRTEGERVSDWMSGRCEILVSSPNNVSSQPERSA